MKKQKAGKTAAGKKNIFLFLSILAVVAVSGCISVGDLFGSGTTTVEASSDVMAVSDSAVIPNPPILTGDTFTTSFSMKNLDEFEDAKEVRLELYDWGVCTPSSCSPLKKDNVGWDAIDKTKLQTSYSASFNDISPKDVQQIECQFRAPPSEKIGGIDARCPVRYKLTYDFSGITTTDLNVISNKKFQEMSRAGQAPVVTSVQSKSRGPIKVDFSFGVNQPVRTSSPDSEVKIPMYVRIENKGSGNVKIEGGSYGVWLNIFVPSDLIPKNDCESFKCDEWLHGVTPGPEGAEDKSKCVLTLNDDKKITKDMFVKDKVQSFRCELTSPGDTVVPEQKTFSIQSEVRYTYQIDNDFNVAIRPMAFG